MHCVALTRRNALKTPLLGVFAPPAPTPIDRAKLVRRHNPVQRTLDPMAPLSVGNGEFAFTADLTGLQTFPEAYEAGIPLCTQSQWGWHSFAAPAGQPPRGFGMTEYDTHGRMVGYPTGSTGQKDLFNWLRENPHRLNLGRLALRLKKSDGSVGHAADLAEPEQTLDLWAGLLTSKFQFDGVPVKVETACHPELDLVAVAIESPLLAQKRLEVVLTFPYGSPAVNASDWTRPQAHITTRRTVSPMESVLERRMDGTEYTVRTGYDAAELTEEAPHTFTFRPRTGTTKIAVRCLFSGGTTPPAIPPAAAVFQAAKQGWAKFWITGGAVELDGSDDPRARELERRIVLSQYLTAIQCAGSLPPQETGLTCNSWYGKFHLEMHWWHAVHFVYWDRAPLLERSLDFYRRNLGSAQKLAMRQGYRGARWPKMVGPDARDSPSPIGPLLIWQQPHPIYYAELCYRAKPSTATLVRYRDVVYQTAEFLSSFAWLDPKRGEYVLGPPVIPAQENHPPKETWNPTYELSYFRWALEAAQQWRLRSGLPREPKWEDVRTKLAPLPVKDGLYLAHENCPQTFTERNRDHPSMLAALGVLPGPGVDRETMRRTLRKVMSSWKWPDTWGWDYPMTAMTAARLGEPEIALDALLLDTPKNRYLPNGHNYQRPGLHLYLPGNGGLLTAVALMARGWDLGPEENAPGFPKSGWTVRHEGLKPVI